MIWRAFLFVSLFGATPAFAEGLLDGYTAPTERPGDAATAIRNRLNRFRTERQPAPAPAPPPTAPLEPPELPQAPERAVSIEEATAALRKELGDLPEMLRAIVTDDANPVELTPITGDLQAVNAFFDALKNMFFEREDLLDLQKLTILTESAMLIVGGPGTAKSAQVDVLGENIDAETSSNPEDETDLTSYFTIQLTPETTSAETQGGMIVADGMEGRMRRNWEEGVLGAMTVFLDEFFDGRMNFLRSFLKAFNERKYTQGKLKIKGRTRSFFAASNMYLAQVYEMFGNNKPQAMIDRFQFVYHASRKLRQTGSLLALKRRAQQTIPRIKYKQLEDIKQVASRIVIPDVEYLRSHYIFFEVGKRLEAHQTASLKDARKARENFVTGKIPYYTTRVFTTRSFNIAQQLIQAEAVLRAFERNVPARIEAADVDTLMTKYCALQGQPVNYGDDADPYEASQNETMRLEQGVVREVIETLQAEEAREAAHAEMPLQKLADNPDDPLARKWLATTMAILRLELADIENADKIDASAIAKLGLLRKLHEVATNLEKKCAESL